MHKRRKTSEVFSGVDAVLGRNLLATVPLAALRVAHARLTSLLKLDGDDEWDFLWGIPRLTKELPPDDPSVYDSLPAKNTTSA